MKRLVSKFKSLRHREPPSNSAHDKLTVLPTPAAASSTPAKLENAKPELAAGSTPENSLIESLPPEIRLQLLSQLALDELRALVHASPVFHCLYLLNRKSLLRRSLAVTLCNITPDAIAAYESSTVGFQSSRTVGKVTDFLQRYQNMRDKGAESILGDDIPIDQVAKMITFHLTTMQPLAQLYSQWAQDAFPEATKPLSASEHIRISRAMYRFHLYCNLYGPNWGSSSLWPEFDPEGILRSFFCEYTPWEIEEILCIASFAQNFYDQIFHIIQQDLHPTNRRFSSQGYPPTPEGAFDLDNTWTRYQLLHGTVQRGLHLLHSVSLLRTSADHEGLIHIMQEHMCPPRGGSLDEIFKMESPQVLRREKHPIDGDGKELRRDPLPFMGDDDTDVHGPPQAWTIIWKGTYSNSYGWYIPDSLRRWGYVMWDADSLKRFGGNELLAHQWDACWNGEDPRYFL
ncbi:hypothetical protein B0J11DRAFT_529711 [Dendryphion nanum]|uniref:F-box domain-containing protein n=1 Tax=Dendryphion nanum TaxID=256645 RepID=A0A9P9IKD7_9PLEO|nr:hypothetical protein B0J11DRAFT_529711 [Dendryphion nanum]